MERLTSAIIFWFATNPILHCRTAPSWSAWTLKNASKSRTTRYEPCLCTAHYWPSWWSSFAVLAVSKYSLFGSTRCFEVLALSKYSLFRSTRSFEVLALSKYSLFRSSRSFVVVGFSKYSVFRSTRCNTRWPVSRFHSLLVLRRSGCRILLMCENFEKKKSTCSEIALREFPL